MSSVFSISSLLGDAFKGFVNDIMTKPEALAFLFFIALFLGTYAAFTGLLKFALKDKGQLNSKQVKTVAFMFSFIGSSGLVYILMQEGDVGTFVTLFSGLGGLLVMIFFAFIILRFFMLIANEYAEISDDGNIVKGKIYWFWFSIGTFFSAALIFGFTGLVIERLAGNAISNLFIYANEIALSITQIAILAAIIFGIMAFAKRNQLKEKLDEGRPARKQKKETRELIYNVEQIINSINKRTNQISTLLSSIVKAIQENKDVSLPAQKSKVEYEINTVSTVLLKYKTENENLSHDLIKLKELISKINKDNYQTNELFGRIPNPLMFQGGISNPLKTKQLREIFSSVKYFSDEITKIIGSKEENSGIIGSIQEEIKILNQHFENLNHPTPQILNVIKETLIRYSKEKINGIESLKSYIKKIKSLEVEAYGHIDQDFDETLKPFANLFKRANAASLGTDVAEEILTFKILIEFLNEIDNAIYPFGKSIENIKMNLENTLEGKDRVKAAKFLNIYVQNKTILNRELSQIPNIMTRDFINLTPTEQRLAISLINKWKQVFFPTSKPRKSNQMKKTNQAQNNPNQSNTP